MIQAPCLALASYCSKLPPEALQKHCQHCIFLQVSARLRLSQHAIDLVVGVKEGLDISAYDGSRFCKDGSHQAPNHQRQFEAIRVEVRVFAHTESRHEGSESKALLVV